MSESTRPHGIRSVTDFVTEVAARARKKRQAPEVPIPPELPAPKEPVPGVQLPLWPEPIRGVPNSVLRSALFGAIKRGRRAFQQGEPIAAVDGVTILFTGPRLDQADLDVWEQCLHIARTGGLGCRIQFSAHGFLKAIRRDAGGKQHEWLRNTFRRLAASVVEIKHGKRAYFGPMLHHGTRDDETGNYVVEINPAIVALYGPDGWSQVEWQQRQALKRQPLAQWLHGFYTTHAEPYPVKVETIHRLSGSENKSLKDYRRELREAMEKLAEVTEWEWEVDDDDRLLVRKPPTPAQVRHLTRKRLARLSKDTG